MAKVPEKNIVWARANFFLIYTRSTFAARIFHLPNFGPVLERIVDWEIEVNLQFFSVNIADCEPRDKLNKHHAFKTGIDLYFRKALFLIPCILRSLQLHHIM